MSASAVAGVLACLLTLLLVPPVIRLCNRWQLLDRPGALKIHTQPIPRLGGVPLVIGISAAVLAVERSVAMRSWPFLAALALVWVAGLIDDVRSLSILFRLAAQFAAAAFLWRHGWVVPLSGVGVANLIATSIFVVAFVNAVNFLDGSDGLAAGVAAIIAIAFVLAGISSANLFHAVLAPAVAGACLGFLRYNLPPAHFWEIPGAQASASRSRSSVSISGDPATQHRRHCSFHCWSPHFRWWMALSQSSAEHPEAFPHYTATDFTFPTECLRAAGVQHASH